MKSIFDENTFKEVEERINKLDENTKAQWGKMSVGQMAWHCQGPLNIMLGKNHYGMTKPNWFAILFFKKSLYNDKPWRKGLPTAKFLKAAEEKDFKSEKVALLELLSEVGDQLDKENWGKHPGFGYFTDDQWGRMQYKHLNHHLRQFGV
ncbi:MAG: DUF1569 domain-containing protein [Flavobacteriaceae bacterium]|nr:DUF1569 domain-containing protein [Bacteroidia bacterium]NND10920.1 DUF1569 domain-containing protein [Flavobacteriaceae bacterium]NNL59708.1 DUF1569 domain-containing protein [Flavobacteriaceae bacterium]